MLKMPKKPTPPVVPVEVVTTRPNGSSTLMKKYIVLARSTTSAIDGVLEQKKGETFLHAAEMTDYELIIIK